MKSKNENGVTQSNPRIICNGKELSELVRALISIGIESYTVDVSTGIILYRRAEGETILHMDTNKPRSITESFDLSKTIQAVKDTQQGKTNYPEFISAIANTGVRFYEATLNGNNKRVNYIGYGGNYEETIPV